MALELNPVLRDLQDASAYIDGLAEATDLDQFRRSFDAALSHLRSAQYKLQRAVKTAARQEPGRPRVKVATEWWAEQASVISTDPLLCWARDARDDAIHESGRSRFATELAIKELTFDTTASEEVFVDAEGIWTISHAGTSRETRRPAMVPGGSVTGHMHVSIAVVDPPTSHMGQEIPESSRTPDGLLALCLQHTSAMYDRARTDWG